MSEPLTARNGAIFKAAWQRSLENTIRSELAPIAKKHADAAYREMNQKVLEVVANIQARFILSQGPDEMNNKVTMQLLLPTEMQNNPPDGGQI